MASRTAADVCGVAAWFNPAARTGDRLRVNYLHHRPSQFVIQAQTFAGFVVSQPRAGRSYAKADPVRERTR
jgi:hypothetical protein